VARRSAPAAPAGPLVEVRQVTCTYGGPPVLVGVDLVVEAGSFLGVVGPSGSGKTTLLRVLTGAVVPASGQVRRRPGLRMGFVPQVGTVNWDFPVSVAQCVLMARTKDRRVPWASRQERHQLAAVLDRLGLAELAGRHIRELSGGQQQRMFLARALLTGSDLVLLDEPTSGLDVKTRHEVLHLLDELSRDGLAVVVSTHDLNGIAAHLPELLCLNVEVVAAGRPTDILTPPVLERTYGAPMDVLLHGGMPVVIDARHDHGRVIPFPTAVPEGEVG
jgi:ABC-type Mn2+/Zn2+ transport system ATPase subunit